MPYHLKPTAYACLLVLLALLCGTACTDTLDDAATADGRTATVCLRIPQIKPATRAGMTLEEAEDAIHKLRVVVVHEGKQTNNIEFTSDKISKGIVTLEQVPVGQVELYVIANELSIDNGYTTTTDGKLLVQDPTRKCFPKRGTEFLSKSNSTAPIGLPMGWINKTQTIQEGENTIDVQLERQVAKLNIQMYNTLSSDITITTISFGTFFSDRFYFVRQGTLDVPEETEYISWTFDKIGTDGNGITIGGGTTGTMVCYVYPSFAWKNSTTSSPYTIGFKTKAGVEYGKQAFVNNYGALNSILRNTQINIYATLSKSANVDIKFNVTEWTEKDIVIPPFD